MQRDVRVVAELDALAVFDGVIDARNVGIEPPDVDVERLDDAVEIADVIRMGVSQDDGVEVRNVFADGSADVEVVADVDQHCALAGHEKHVAREHLLAGGEVRDHTRP